VRQFIGKIVKSTVGSAIAALSALFLLWAAAAVIAVALAGAALAIALTGVGFATAAVLLVALHLSERRLSARIRVESSRQAEKSARHQDATRARLERRLDAAPVGRVPAAREPAA
jgi:membrane protein implicated in regulation of membrane protease activity